MKTISCLLKRIVTALTQEFDLKIKGFCSTTLNRQDLEQGAEPDSCFYIQNVDRILGKRLDISTDPPPDLMIEVDITSPSSNRFVVYTQLGIPEVWRYRSQTVQIYQLHNREYISCDRSPTFPILSVAMLNQLLQMAETEDDMTIIEALRVWVREQLRSPKNEQ
jgi:Uma2 family endonuclease